MNFLNEFTLHSLCNHSSETKITYLPFFIKRIYSKCYYFLFSLFSEFLEFVAKLLQSKIENEAGLQ